MTRLCIATEPHEHEDARPAPEAVEHWAPRVIARKPLLVAHCKPMRGAHFDSCEDHAHCPGCLPQIAADPLLVCHACRLRIGDRIEELPQLWDDLLTPTKSGGSAKRAPGAERPSPLGDDARNARDAVGRLLDTWYEVLHQVVFVRQGPAPSATQVEQAHSIRAYLAHLLADERYAGQLVHDVDTVWAEARRRAYPAQPLGHVIGDCPVGTSEGPCGGQVRAVIDTLDEQGWAKCGTCKTRALIDWWLALMPPEAHEFLGMKALRWHLALHCGRQINESTIRGWASTSGPRPEPQLPSVLDEASGRTLYRVEEARSLCELTRRRGRPRQETMA